MNFVSFEKSVRRALKAQTSPYKYFDSQNKIDAKTLHRALGSSEKAPELLRELEQIVYGYNRFY